MFNRNVRINLNLVLASVTTVSALMASMPGKHELPIQ